MRWPLRRQTNWVRHYATKLPSSADDQNRDWIAAYSCQQAIPGWHRSKLRLRGDRCPIVGLGRRLGQVLLQLGDLLLGPVADVRHLDPCVDVVRRGVDMAMADRCYERHEHVQRQL